MYSDEAEDPDMYVLDTKIWIEYLTGNQKIIDKIQEVGLDNCFLIDFVVAELRFWAEIGDNPNENHEKISNLAWRSDVATVECKRIKEDIYNKYWRYKAELYQQNKHMDMLCLMLATFAHPYFAIVTDRVDEFAKFDGLKIENWLVD